MAFGYRLVSIVTTSFRRDSLLRTALPTWARQDYPSLEVMVGLDEGSSLWPLPSSVRGVPLEGEHFLRCTFRNRVWRLSFGEILAFVDGDVCIRDPGWLSLGVTKMREGYDLLISAPLLDGQDVGGLSGTFLIKRWVMEKIRGWNEALDLRWGYEDNEVYTRAQRAGARAGGLSVQGLHHLEHDDTWRTRCCQDTTPSDRMCSWDLQVEEARKTWAQHPFEVNRFTEKTK